ncbi:ATPase [Hoeflea sp. BAL378]|uniref:ATP-binding protein n=1 Tax=Hoeflea sp. BAL378 TaxID=1547437 RepID=UPI0005129E40|nr:ATP-binding protein [Hoeflea sp. BAL378]KGF68759.1 ATPase [Hoeflea sp. BAL378]
MASPIPEAEDERDRRGTYAAGNRLLGRVIGCSGSKATVSALAGKDGGGLAELWSVGRLISISVGANRVVALVYSMTTASASWSDADENVMHIEVELVGEIHTGVSGKTEFSAGISQYPYLGAVVHRMRSSDLAVIYDPGVSDTAVIGSLTQDPTLGALIHVPSLLSRHFAVVGTTGVGKTTAVTLLLHKALQADPSLRVLILDPHNEFAAAFPTQSVVIDTDTLDLPFWLFKLEEFTEVLFRGRPPIPEEIDVLRDLIPEAKRMFKGSTDTALIRRGPEKSSLTADTPVPYRVADLMALIDERIGKLEGRSEKPHLRSLKVRIQAAINDPRYEFMFSSNTIHDTILQTISHIFRIPGDGKPVTTFQLSGIPSEVVNSVASILCRMAFEIALWSAGGVRILVVCEEAHRYVPADPNLGFFPTRQAISRIAKEGRKYGVSLGVITQRPGELDPTILSQCSTVFAMRLSNDHDQDIIRSAIPDSSASTMSFLSSIGNGEAIAFGEAVAVPMRMMFERVSENVLPRANSGLQPVHRGDPNGVDLRKIVMRMRHIDDSPKPQAPQHVPGRPQSEQLPSIDPMDEFGAAPARRRFSDQPAYAPPAPAPERGYGYNEAAPEAAPAAPRHELSSLRSSLLKKPLSSLLKD